MELPESTWAAVSNLGLGERVMLEHDCGPGKKLVVSRDAPGWAAWCYRCSPLYGSAFRRAPQPTMEEILAMRARQAKADAAARVAACLPEPQNHDPATWPVEARAWLYRGGIGDSRIRHYGIYYHPDMRRVVLPVAGGAWWQARAVFPNQVPKYLSAGNGSRVLASYGRNDDAPAVLVEDILSAMRIDMAGFEGVSLLGTSMSDVVLAYLVRRDMPVCVWLDPDGPGQKAAGVVAQRLRSVGLVAKVIHSEQDPKRLQLSQIRSALGVQDG